MSEQTFSIKLHLYDLLNFDPTNGMARSVIQQIVPGFRGIWHTGIVVYGKEYYFGGGILNGSPSQTPYGTPVEIIDLGTTQITQDVFEAFIEEMGEKYNVNTYDLFTNNCNNFTNDASQFLTGKPIPQHITDLPQQFLETNIGKMLLPLIRNFTGQGNFSQNQGNGMFNPGAMPDLGNMFGGGQPGAGGMPNLANMFGGAGGAPGGMPNLANMFGGAGGMPNLANMFGGAGGAPNFGNMFGGGGMPNFGAQPNAFNSPTPTPVNTQTQSGHSTLKLKTLVINSKQPTLFSTSVSIDKVFAKLNQFIAEASFQITPEQVKILTSLQNSLENRKQNPNYEIPVGTFKLSESLIKQLPLEKLFPFLDILRLLVLHKTVSDFYSNSQGIEIIDYLLKNVILTETPNDASQFLGARVICNLFSNETSVKRLLDSSRVDELLEVIHQGLNSSVKQFQHTVATIIYNICINLDKDSDLPLQLVSAIVFALNSPDSLSDEVAFTLLMSLGRLSYNSQEVVGLVEALELQLSPYLTSQVEKVKYSAEELKLLLSTPVE